MGKDGLFGPGQFGCYLVERRGWRYQIVHIGNDGVWRDMCVGEFWRWHTAALIAQGMWLSHLRGQRGE